MKGRVYLEVGVIRSFNYGILHLKNYYVFTLEILSEIPYIWNFKIASDVYSDK